MVDSISVERRSALMRRIRGAGNESTEVALAKILRQAGLSGWRRQQHIGWVLPSLSPRLRVSQQTHRFRATVAPDFVFRQKRVALFVDGCFWHSCPKHGTMPSSNVDFGNASFRATVPATVLWMLCSAIWGGRFCGYGSTSLKGPIGWHAGWREMFIDVGPRSVSCVLFEFYGLNMTLAGVFIA